MKNFWYFGFLGIIACAIVVVFNSPIGKMFTGIPHALFYVADIFAAIAMGMIIGEWATHRAEKMK